MTVVSLDIIQRRALFYKKKPTDVQTWTDDQEFIENFWINLRADRVQNTKTTAKLPYVLCNNDKTFAHIK